VAARIARLRAVNSQQQATSVRRLAANSTTIERTDIFERVALKRSPARDSHAPMVPSQQVSSHEEDNETFRTGRNKADTDIM